MGVFQISDYRNLCVNYDSYAKDGSIHPRDNEKQGEPHATMRKGIGNITEVFVSLEKIRGYQIWHTWTQYDGTYKVYGHKYELFKGYDWKRPNVTIPLHGHKPMDMINILEAKKQNYEN